MIFTHSGNAGDIIFSIPTINHLTSGERKAIVYIKTAKYVYGDQFTFVKDLLLLQEGIKEVHPFTPAGADDWNYFRWPGLTPDYDLDYARLQRQRGMIHIVKRYFDQFGIVKDHTRPFLAIDDEEIRHERFALIHLTPRWNGLQYDWARIYNEAKERHGKVYFTGFVSEHLDFTIRYGEIEHLQTENLLELARLIRDAEAIYCNQNVALTIAQGLGKQYYLARNGMKTNCCLYTSNEYLFDGGYFIAGNTMSMPPDSHLIRSSQ